MTSPLVSLRYEDAGMSAGISAGIKTCDAAEDLAAINKPDMELVIWQRALPLCLTTWLDQLDASRLPDMRVLVQPSELRRAVEPLLDDSGLPAGDFRDLLLGDINNLVSAFAGITGTDLVDVRLERLSHDACWKFHRDSVEARLLTTYRGSATDWVKPRHATQALREQKSYAGPLERLRVHDVAIFKGSSAGPGNGIVHRSPPIAGTGQTRLLLVLNKPLLSSPKRWDSLTNCA